MFRARENVAALPVDAPARGEQELVAQLRCGSVDAFNYLIAIYHQPIYQLMVRMLGDACDASDAVQEVFLKVFRAASQFEGKSSIKTWLYRIAVHEASNHRRWWRRHKGRELSLEQEEPGGTLLSDRIADPAPSPLQQALQSEAARQLSTALEAISEPYRTVLLLRELEGFSYDEIAEVLQVRTGTVKSRLVRGREALRRQLLGENEPAGVRLTASRTAALGTPEDE
jgi:RNA polymerase sigma-70 factor (ECF subfamily)